MLMPAFVEVREGLCQFRPKGEYSLIETVELITRVIAYCREGGVRKLLINATGLIGVPVPSLVDRFLMVEEWAHEAKGTVSWQWSYGPNTSIRASLA